MMFVWLIFFGVYALISIITLIMMLCRQKYDMIRIRSPWRMGLMICSGCIMFSLICWREMDRSAFPCGLYIIVSNLFTPMYFLPLFSLATSLHYAYDSQKESGVSTTRYVVDYLENIKRRRGLFMAASSVVIAAHIAVAGVQMWIAGGSAPLSEGCQWKSEAEFIVLAAVSMVYAFTFGVVIVVLRNIQDPYKVSHELRLGFAWSLLWTTIFFTFNLIPQAWYLDDIMPFSIFILIMIAGMQVITGIIPVMLSRRADYMYIAEDMMRDRELLYNEVYQYISSPLAMNALERWCMQNKRQRVLRMFMLLYNYLMYPTTRSAAISFELYTYLSVETPDTVKNAPSTEESAALDALIVHHTVPQAAMFKVYLRPMKDLLTEICVDPFTTSDAYADMMATFTATSTTGAHLHSIMNESESSHMHLLHFDAYDEV